MQRLTRSVSVIRMANRRRGGHVDLRVAVTCISTVLEESKYYNYNNNCCNKTSRVSSCTCLQ